MADVSKIVLINGDEYDLKDSTARSGLSGKADKATTLSGYGITNAYTKTEVDSLVSSVFTYKGTKATYSQVSALTDMKTGDVWQVTADNSEYVYNGTAWEKLGPTIDLSGYLTSVSVAGQSLTPGSNSITVAQLKTALGLGSAAYVDTESTVANDSKLPTGAAIQSYVTGLGYTTNTGTVTKVSTGAGLTGGDVTTTGTIKADLKSETKSSLTAASKGSTTNREYAVGLDANGDLSVNIPWENTQTVTGVKGSSESSYRTGNVSISASNIGLGNVENKSSATIRGELTSQNVIDALGYTPGSSGGTVTSVATGTGLTGGPITTSGTISLEGGVVTAGSAGPTAAVTGNEGNTVAIPRITVDEYGRVTGLTSYNLTNKNTTYTAATTAPGNVASSSAVGTSINYARQDHTHGISLATGDSNGQVKIAGTNVSVKGLGSAAYVDTESTVANDSKLPTGAAVKSFVEGKGYTTNTGTITGVSVNGTSIATSGVANVPVPTKVSDLTNDSGFITSYTETDPTVPAWAKAASKPTYTASEVGALPDTTEIPSKTSDLTNDSGFMSDDYLVISTESSSPTDEERMEAIRLAMQSNGLLSYVGHAILSETGSVWPIAAMFKDDYSAGSILRINWGNTQLLKYKYYNSTWSTDTYVSTNDGITRLADIVCPDNTNENSYSCAWSNYRAVLFTIGNYNNVYNSLTVPYVVLNTTSTATKIYLLFFSNSGSFLNTVIIRKNDESSIYVQFTAATTTHRLRVYGLQ